MSTGISLDVQSTISRLIAYRIPTTLNENAIDTHPVALRYYYKGPRECILLCSQSNGRDENGRPGNFFSHTLVTESDIFTTMPPILYWRSPFWRNKDPETRTQLPSLPDFEVEPQMDIEQVWDFLGQGNRNQLFYKLMCAVVHSSKKQRRIVIIDTIDNVALWIAAVSCMLPPECRPLLTFATYHHDPYQAHFLITGTTSDSSFHATPEEYISYFILNAEKDMISKIDDSPYASLAAEAARSMDVYETQLLSFFADCSRRFPPLQSIDEQLDLMARYFEVIKRQNQTAMTPDELKSISLALTEFEQLQTYDEDDVKDLRRIGRVLSAVFKSQRGNDPVLIREYKRVVRLWKAHGIATEEAAVEDLKAFTSLLLLEIPTAIDSIDGIRRVHGDEAFVAAINHPAYLRKLTQFIQNVGARPLQLVWEQIGPYVQPHQESRGLLVVSLNLLGELWVEKKTDEAKSLLEAILQAMEGMEQQWLQMAANDYNSISNGVVERFYFLLVYRLFGFNLDQRVPYRAIILPVSPRVAESEILRDVTRVGPQKGCEVIEQWLEHAKRRYPESIPPLINSGLARLSKYPQQWNELAPKILTSNIIAPLLQPEWEDHLVNTALSVVSFSHFSPANIEMCRRYQKRPGLSDETRTIIAGLLAMTSGNLDEALARQLRTYFKTRSQEEYLAEANAFIAEFFKTRFTAESHAFLVAALSNEHYKDFFWQAYWNALSDILTNPVRAGTIIDLLEFWFVSAPNRISHHQITQRFFLELPYIIDDARKVRGFNETAREINSRAAKQRLEWYPLVQDLLSERQNMFMSVGQNLAKRFAGQNEDDEAAKARAERFNRKVASLFEGRKIVDTHIRGMREVYTMQRREQFWSFYWEQFVNLLVSREPEEGFELLSFWFENSLDEFGQLHFVVQDFFLGLYETLDAAQKERGFRDAARRINTMVMSQKQGINPWYPLVQTFFLGQGAGFFSFFRRE